MSTLIYDLSMSLDGYVAGPNRRRGAELGDSGEHLHTWVFDSEDAIGREVLSRSVSETGAIICGRTTYDDSLRYWGADGPTGAKRVPVIVVTHNPPSDPPEGGAYTFVTRGIEDALAQARAAAAGKSVALAAGPNVGNQFLRAGLVDELSVHIAPVLFGDGTRLTESLPRHVEIELVEHLIGAKAAHLRYRVVRPTQDAMGTGDGCECLA